MKGFGIERGLTVLILCAGAAMAQGGPGQGPGPRMMPGGPSAGRGFGGPGMEMLGGPVVTGAPYSGTEVLTIQEKFADGNSVNTTTSSARARDTQGRTYSSETVTPPASTGKSPFTRTTIMDPVAGERYELNSSTMIAIESRLPKAPPAHTPPTPPTLPSTTTLPNGATVTVSSLGSATVNGVAATGTQTTEVIPAGAIGNAQAITVTRATWISTELKLPVEIKSSDPRTGTSDMELTGISTGEPSASLFTVPSGYTIKNGGPGGRGPGGRGGRGGSGGQGAFRRGGPPAQ